MFDLLGVTGSGLTAETQSAECDPDTTTTTTLQPGEYVCVWGGGGDKGQPSHSPVGKTGQPGSGVP